MATVARVLVETYLHTAYRPDVDYVDGVIEDRNLGEEDHSKWQLAIMRWFMKNEEAWGVLVRPELRIHTNERHYRVADVTMLDAALSRERIPTHPPLIVFEVLSPEDRLSRVKERLADFAMMGIRKSGSSTRCPVALIASRMASWLGTSGLCWRSAGLNSMSRRFASSRSDCRDPTSQTRDVGHPAPGCIVIETSVVVRH